MCHPVTYGLLGTEWTVITGKNESRGTGTGSSDAFIQGIVLE